jgi:alpha/beta superfamily hydrolase
MLGGNFNDSVVIEICRAADTMGIATLRFNFRGVGESQGEFTNGAEEHQDAKAALDVLRRWPGIDKKNIAMVGYSLGAAVVLDSLKSFKHARVLVLVAPTVKSVHNDRFKKDKRPRLIVAGSNDRVAPSLELQRELDKARQPVRFTEITDADHTMQGRETEVARIVADFISESLS